MPQFLLTFDFLYLYYFFFQKKVRHSSINFKNNIFKTLFGFFFFKFEWSFFFKNIHCKNG